jgi:hypothetical protein
MTKRLTTPNEILQAALDKEMQARDFYAELERNCSVDFVKELLLTLANEGETWGQTYSHRILQILSILSKPLPPCNCMSVPLS